jgi:SET domain-containing protein
MHDNKANQSMSPDSTTCHASPTKLPLNAISRRPYLRRIQAKRSSIHGKGLFALAPFANGEFIIEYVGQRITMRQAEAAWKASGSKPHTFLWILESGGVIDGMTGGNSARWLNHSCAPNVQATESENGRVFIAAARDIRAGEELFLDYHLTSDERHTPALKRLHACRCGASKCRGTMLAPKR